MGIKDLPTGKNFSMRIFRRKFSSNTRYGSYKRLRKHTPGILEVIQEYEAPIRRGEFGGRQRQLAAYRKARDKSRTAGAPFTKEDTWRVKEVFKQLGQGTAGAAKKAKPLAKGGPGGKSLTPEQIRRNLREAMQRDPVAKRGGYETTQYARGKVLVASSIGGAAANPTFGGVNPTARGARIMKGSASIVGTAADLNSAIKRSIGFAGQYKNNSQSSSPPPKMPPLGGVRPVGL